MSAFQPGSSLATENLVAAATRRAGPARRRFQRSTALSSSRPFLADAGSGPGNRAGMEEATGAPSSFAALSPRRLRASRRDGGGVVTRPPSSLSMLLSRHTRRRQVIAGMASAAFARPHASFAQEPERLRRVGVLLEAGTYHVGVDGLREGLKRLTARTPCPR